MAAKSTNKADRLNGTNATDIIDGLNGNDTIFGRGGNDRLFGGDGNDIVDGGEGHDYLYGGAGNDTLIGGEGFDDMTGGDGADVFQFKRLSFQGSIADQFGKYVSSVIEDFVRGIDLIDFSRIDADTTKAGNQAFHFAPGGGIGVEFTKTPGELIKEVGPGRVSTYIAGDMNGDGTADFRVQIYSNRMLVPSDFKL